MSESYYKPCRELDICNEMIEKYFNTQQYEKCFEGHLVLAEQGDPARSDISITMDWEWKRILPRPYGGHAGRPITVTGTDSATWLGSMRMASVWSGIWNRRRFGTGKQPCRIMT